MNDDPLEERIRASFRRLDLPDAPEGLIDRAVELGSAETAPRSSKVGLVLVLATVLAVSVYGSLMMSTGARGPTPVVAPSPSASEAGTPTSTAKSTPAPTPTPTLRPFPVDRPYPSAPPVEPSANDVLALAGRGDVPGLIYCGFGLPFTVDALQNPTGAEDSPGPEYSALRDLLARYVELGAPELGPNPTAREVAHEDSGAMFLVDHAGTGPGGRFPFVPIAVDLVEGRWEGSYGVDCNPQAVLPPGFEAATWMIDPAYSAPTPKTRTLRLLVQEHACASGRSPSGRIGPAYVVATKYEISIGVMVERLPGGQDCPAAPPTPARVSLPEPIGDRFLWDMHDYLLNQSGG